MFKKLYFFFILALSSLGGYTQNSFKYQTIEASNYFLDTTYQYEFYSELRNIYINGFEVENALPAGFVKDGSVDYTQYLQNAIDEHRYLIFPPFPLLINDKGLTFHSNTHVVFREGSMLILSASNKSHYQCIRIKNVSNVSLFYPVIIGDRYIHEGQDGEWGMGMSILGAKNIVIFSPVISKCWGDAIYISGGEIPYSSKLKIYNAFCDDNRRNGISIISACNIKLINVIASNSHGTNPMSGIDIEPNRNSNVIDSLYFKSIYTINNYKAGFKIQLRNLLKSNDSPSVHIKIINHYSLGSEISFALAPVIKKDNAFMDKVNPIKGEIVIEAPQWINYRKRPLNGWNYGKLGPQVYINSPRIQKSAPSQPRMELYDLKSAQLKRAIKYLKNTFEKETNIQIQ